MRTGRYHRERIGLRSFRNYFAHFTYVSALDQKAALSLAGAVCFIPTTP
jgi:hypothetical protein